MRFDGRKYIKTVVDILPAEGAASAKSSVASKAQKASVKKTTKKQTTKKEQPKTTASDTKKATKTTKAKTTTAKSTSTNTTKKKSSGDDFTKIKGIDSVISDLLHANGITSFDKLSSAKVGDLRDILADNDLTTHEPMPWKKQATLAKNEKWDELKEYQDTV